MFTRLGVCLIFLEIASFAAGAPVESASETAAQQGTDCQNESTDVYDQRQNGTENYRIHVDGMVVLVAPAEAVLQAAALGSLPINTELDNTSTQISQQQKPKPKPPAVTEKVPSEATSHETPRLRPKEKNNLKLLNLLQMFRSVNQGPEGTIKK